MYLLHRGKFQLDSHLLGGKSLLRCRIRRRSTMSHLEYGHTSPLIHRRYRQYILPHRRSREAFRLGSQGWPSRFRCRRTTSRYHIDCRWDHDHRSRCSRCSYRRCKIPHRRSLEAYRLGNCHRCIALNHHRRAHYHSLREWYTLALALEAR